MRLGIIGGTGVKREQLLPTAEGNVVETPFGEANVWTGRLNGIDVAFLARHGPGHKVPPHAVNYRANIWALHSLGCRRIIATAAVGSLHADWLPGTLVCIDTFLDFTHGRESTFYTGEDGNVVHVDVTYPYCETLRNILRREAEKLQVPLRERGCYVCTNGPRYETAAEVRMFAQLGGDVVGMTGVPEVVLARELGLCYATVALVTNLGAGLQQTKLKHGEVETVMQQSGQMLTALLVAGVPQMVQADCHSCRFSA